ncbi:hypothetical protein AB0N05_27055 [Nocardia sp. NPDC051030]|uniref:hypothetical protein n=1 Tax=Nocardia sp. NPDC051030 TaxID=3155162 RepID=UPI003421197E
MGAEPYQVEAGIWGTADLHAWRRPDEIPRSDIPIQVDDAGVTAGAQGSPLQLQAFVTDIEALIGRAQRGVETDVSALAAVLADLAEHLQQQHPELTRLIVREFNDPVLRDAASAAGFELLDRSMSYRLTRKSASTGRWRPI